MPTLKRFARGQLFCDCRAGGGGRNLGPREAAREDRRFGIADLRRHTARGMIVNSVYQVLLVGISALRALILAVFLTQDQYGVWGTIGVVLWTALSLKSVFGAEEKYVQQSDPDQEG